MQSICLLLAMYAPYMSHLDSLGLSFLICKMGITTRIVNVIVLFWGVTEIICKSEDVEHWNSQTLLGRQKGRATLENSLVASHRVKNILPIWTGNPIRKCLPQRNKNIRPHKPSMWVVLAVAFPSFRKKATQWPQRPNGWTVRSHTEGYCSAISRNELLTLLSTWVTLMAIILGERSKKKDSKWRVPLTWHPKEEKLQWQKVEGEISCKGAGGNFVGKCSLSWLYWWLYNCMYRPNSSNCTLKASNFYFKQIIPH